MEPVFSYPGQHLKSKFLSLELTNGCGLGHEIWDGFQAARYNKGHGPARAVEIEKISTQNRATEKFL
jgi:hypothetical protein